MHLAFFVLSKQLSESEESEGEAENKKEKNTALSSGRKYIPPKIAAVHYGNVWTFFWFLYLLKMWVSVELKWFENSTWTWSLLCLFREFRKHSTLLTHFLQMATWQKQTGRRLRRNGSGGLRSGAPWSRSWDSSTVMLPRRSGRGGTSRVSGRAARSCTGAYQQTSFGQLDTQNAVVIKTLQFEIACSPSQMRDIVKIFAGKITRSRWWCVSTCPNIRRMPKREAWWECPTSWAASHTSVTSQHWLAATAVRWEKGRHHWAGGLGRSVSLHKNGCY